MIWPSLVTITPEPNEFWTSASSFGLRNCCGLRLKNSNGSSAYWRRIAILREVFTLTTEGITLLTNARRSRFKEASVRMDFGSTLALDARVYFSGVARAKKFRRQCLRW